MKTKQLVFFAFILILPVQLKALGAWHEWSSATMTALAKTNCTIQYSKTAVYQDSSMLVTYSKGASLTFPYNYASSSINTGGWFLMPFLDLSANHVQDTVKVEFLLNGVVKASYKMNARKPGWNLFKVHQIASTNSVSQGFDTCKLSGTIPDIPTQIRISFPNNSGSVYLGKVLLCPDATWTALRMAPEDRKEDFISPSLYKLPTTLVNVSVAQQTALQQIAVNMDEAFNVSADVQLATVPAATMTDLQTRYKTWNIVRNGSILNGIDSLIYNSTPDYHTTLAVFGDLALDIARNYRNTQSATDKATLLALFYDLFDFGIFRGGMYESWNNGVSFADATFLMRTELQQSGRLTPEVLSDFKTNTGYNRIFLPYSYMAKGMGLYTGRVYRTGELGEDMDYFRLTSHRLILFNLLNNNPAEQVRDMTAISSYFSNFVFQYSPTVLDGFKPDGTLNHHWGWIDQYGLDGLHWATRIVYVLSNTEFKVTQPAYQLVYDLLKAQDMRSLNNIVPVTLSGKGGMPYDYGGNTQESVDRFAYMALAGEYNGGTVPDSYMSQTFMRKYANQVTAPYNGQAVYTFSAFENKAKNQLSALGFTANSEPSGHKTLSYGAAFIHRRDKWIVSLKTNSRYQFVRQSNDPWITYFANGMLEINGSTWLRYGSAKLQSDFGANGYDWRKMPGTTSVNFADITKIICKESYYFRTANTFVGGVMQDGNGVFTMQIPSYPNNSSGLASFTGNKSYFCFDNTIVCLGSNISNNVVSDSTITTLFQDAVSTTDSTYIDNKGLTTSPYNAANYLYSPSWLMNSHKVGYWIPVEQNLRFSRISQSNKNWTNTATVTGTLATAWLNHGIGPKNVTYSYFMKLNTSRTEMLNFDAQMQGSAPPVTVLAMTDKLHAVESVSNNSYAAAVINAGSNINLKDVISVSKPCVFILKTLSSTQKKLSVAYPDLDFIDNGLYSDQTWWSYSNTNTVQLKLKGNWSLANPVSPNVSVISKLNNVTTIQYLLKDGLTTDALITLDTTAIDTIQKASDPKIIATPTEISISLPVDGWSNTTGQILSLDGKTIQGFVMDKSVTSVLTINFVHGAYLIHLKSDSQTFTRKVII